MNTEIELKLVGTPDDFKRLLRSRWIKSLSAQGASRHDLTTTYFDTDARDLMRKGVSLRIRRDGPKRIQTFKYQLGADDADRLPVVGHRTEWETEVASDKPDLERIPLDALDDELRAKLGGRIQPLFETSFERTIHLIETEAGDTVELAIDLGKVSATDGEEPIAEVELELKSGSAQALFDLAQHFLKRHPLRISTRSKAQQGYSLVDRKSPAAQSKAKKKGRPAATYKKLPDFWRFLFGSAAEALIEQEGIYRESRHPESIHQLRVALRRFRAGLKACSGLIPEEAYQSLRERAKRYAGIFGEVRDCDVFLDELIRPLRKLYPANKGIAAVERNMEARRLKALEKVDRLIATPDYRCFPLVLGRESLVQGLMAAPKKPSAKALAKQALSKRLKRVEKLGAHFDKHTEEERHALRKAMKELRYTADYFAPLFDAEAVDAYYRTLKTLQDDLGEANDAAVGTEMIEGEVRSLTATGDEAESALLEARGLVRGWYAGRSVGLDKRTRRAWKAFQKAPAFWQ